MSKTKKIVLWLASPYILLVGVAILFAISQFAVPRPVTQDGDLFGQTSGLQTIINVILFLVGSLAVILMPVSVVVAIVIGSRKPAIAPVQPLGQPPVPPPVAPPPPDVPTPLQ